jgi:hypothetical protein
MQGKGFSVLLKSSTRHQVTEKPEYFWQSQNSFLNDYQFNTQEFVPKFYLGACTAAPNPSTAIYLGLESGFGLGRQECYRLPWQIGSGFATEGWAP